MKRNTAPRMRQALYCAALASALPGGNALAGQGNVFFNGNITNNNPCVILLQQDGVLEDNIPGTQLSSKLPGGAPGIAEVWALRAYDVTVDAVTFFTSSPNGGSDNTTFTATFSGQSIFRGRTFAERPGGNAVRLASGLSITRINVNLVVDKPDGFPAGDYETFTILRCE